MVGSGWPDSRKMPDKWRARLRQITFGEMGFGNRFRARHSHNAHRFRSWGQESSAPRSI